MKLTDFDYHLPKGLIASHPVKPRHNSRLLVLNRQDKSIRHLTFFDLVDFLNAGDSLVLNNTKVLSCRLIGSRLKDNLKADFLLLNQTDSSTYRVLVKPYKKIKEDDVFLFNGADIQGRILDIKNRLIRFNRSDILKQLDAIGLTPLPPYIKRLPLREDREDYQTVYAKVSGAVASPTAGLHFTQNLLDKIKAKGVNIAYVTLHVGYGTFRPVRNENILGHKMEREYFKIPAQTLKILSQTRQNNKRIFCVGTTTCRALETAAQRIFQNSDPIEGETDLFIYPGYKFKLTDCLITNFHLPRTTLLMLVSAFAGQGLTMQAYSEAIRKNYRFYSYGDAMLIL